LLPDGCGQLNVIVHLLPDGCRHHNVIVHSLPYGCWQCQKLPDGCRQPVDIVKTFLPKKTVFSSESKKNLPLRLYFARIKMTSLSQKCVIAVLNQVQHSRNDALSFNILETASFIGVISQFCPVGSIIDKMCPLILGCNNSCSYHRKGRTLSVGIERKSKRIVGRCNLWF
jgi:hypothetical protein